MPQPLTLQEKLRRQQQSPKVGPGPWTITPPNGNGFASGIGTFGGMPAWLLLGGAGVLAWFVWKRK
jgi:hypothetical protein